MLDAACILLVFSVYVDWLTFLIYNFSECLSFSSYYAFLQISISSCGWFELVAAQTEEATSRSGITTLLLGSSV